MFFERMHMHAFSEKDNSYFSLRAIFNNSKLLFLSIVETCLVLFRINVCAIPEAAIDSEKAPNQNVKRYQSPGKRHHVDRRETKQQQWSFKW